MLLTWGLTYLVIWYCSLEKCSICWCMHLSVVLHIANIQTVARWRVFSAMGYNAKHVLLEVVFSVRKCGISFNFMLELARNLSATYHVAGLYINLHLFTNLVSQHHPLPHPLSKICPWILKCEMILPTLIMRYSFLHLSTAHSDFWVKIFELNLFDVYLSSSH